MYKKKFRQWKVHGELPRKAKREVVSARPVRHNNISASQLVSWQLEQPQSLKTKQRTIRVLWNDARKRLILQLPVDHAPVMTGGPPRPQGIRFPYPYECLVFQNSLGQGMTMMNEKGTPAAVGALFEKAFKEVEKVIQSTHACLSLYLLTTFMEAYSTGNQSPLYHVLLQYMHNLAVKSNGPDDAIAIWTDCMIQASDSQVAELLVRLAEVFTDSLSAVLGPYDYTSLTIRLRTLDMKWAATEKKDEVLEQWDQLIEDTKQSPDTCDVLVWNTIYYLAQNLLNKGADLPRVVSLLQQFHEKIQNATPEDDLPMQSAWVLVTATNDYARALGTLGQDDLAESSFRIAFIKCTQLLGADCPLLTEVRLRYATFLKERGRMDETDRIYAEIEAELKDFMLEPKLAEGI